MASLDRYYRSWLLLIWLICAAVMIAVSWDAIITWRFPDPDDAMRLVEVRDWLGGQSWFDVSQHRMNAPAGLSMHWSRLLDVPLAAVILLVDLMVGRHTAETIAMVAVPMVTLGAAMVLEAQIARRRDGAAAGLLAAGCCLLSIGSWYALRPLRIDHHGWQIVAGLGLVLALTFRRDWRGAACAGLCAGLWTHISLEGLAFGAGAAAWLGLRWIVSPGDRYRLPIFLGAFAATGSLLYLAVHGTTLIGQTLCDQMSPVHLAAIGLAALLSAAAVRVANSRLSLRVLAMALAALAAGALYRLWAPGCSAGPFGTLGPLGYGLWYRNVYEGVPLWHLPLPLALLWGLFPWIGLVGAALSLRRADTRTSANVDYAALLAAAIAIAVLVTRAGAFANLLAIPGAVSLILRLIRRTEQWRLAPRVIARTLALLLLTPDGAGLAALAVPSPREPANVSRADPNCGLPATLRPLDRLPPSIIMAPLDLGPSLLVATHHSAVTGPYHRDPAALEDVLAFFTKGDVQAIAERRHSSYVAFCASDGEMAAMAKFAPRGLAAALLRGRPPAWLRPMPTTESAGLDLYQIAR